MHSKASGDMQGGWSAAANDQDQWLQGQLVTEIDVKVIGTQGGNGLDQWLTSYKLQYSNDGVSFEYLKKRTIPKHEVCCRL